MKRKDSLLPGTLRTSCVRLSIENLLLFLYISLGITFLTGCGLDRDEGAEPPSITDLTIDPSSETVPDILTVTVQEVATVTAKVRPNKDSDLQYGYEWITTGGDIQHNGVQVDDTVPERGDTALTRITATYIAPKTPGIYTITLRVCTRYAFVEKTVPVEVTDYIVKYIPIDPWKGGAREESLTYTLQVKAVRRSPITLSYTIQQNPRQATADLYLQIGTEMVPVERKIGKTQSLESVIYTNTVDITRHIQQSGEYKFDFKLKTENPIMGNTWLLKEIKVVGIEGNFSPWRSMSGSP